MKTMTSIHKAFCVTAMTFALISAADATTVTRSFVSNIGSDANTSAGCIVTSPCRTLAMALTVTQSGGEIVVMNPGGYGPITISGPLTILGTDGATITAPTGTVGITINAGPTDNIVIRNIQITGANSSSSTGIEVNNGHLVLINSALKMLATGLNVSSAKADLLNVDVVGNTVGVSVTGTGVSTGGPPFTGTAEVRLFNGSAVNNSTAYFMDNPGTGNVSILEFIASGTAAAYSTYMAGNGTLVSGTGTGCPCSSLVVFGGNTNPN